jgi:hypothetical protein
MPMFEVQIVESRDLVFRVEADTEEQATEIANDLEASEAVRDSFRERTHDWTMEV